MSNRVVVTGNGPSMKEINYKLLPKDYDVFRCNEFYLEKEYFIGKKIKAAFFRIDDFFEQYYMMYKLIQNGDYECENIAFKKYNFQDRKEEIFSKNYKYFFPAAIDAYDKYFSKLKKLSDYIDFNVCYNFERKEMLTGTYAICCAVACGYREIYLAGMDLFENKEQDAYFYGKGYGIIESIHNKNKDLEIIKFLQDNYDVKFFSICPTSPINNYIPLGKEQNNQEFIILKKPNTAILKKILPSKKAKLRYKKIYLTSNSFIDFIYNILRAPRAIKRYLNNRYQR